MTRTHFRELANALRLNAPQSNSCKAEADLFRNIVKAVAHVCKRSNSRFDYNRFEAAAGVAAIKAL
jgi:hypothetical protein